MYFANSKQVAKPITVVVPKTLSRNMMTMVQWRVRTTGGWTPVVNSMRMSQVGGLLSRLLDDNAFSLHRLAVHHRSSSLNTPARFAPLSKTSSPSTPSRHPLSSSSHITPTLNTPFPSRHHCRHCRIDPCRTSTRPHDSIITPTYLSTHRTRLSR